MFLVGALVALFLSIQGPAIAEEPEFVMEGGTTAPSGRPWAAELKRYKKVVEERAGGRLKVKLRLGRGNERSMTRRVQMGSMQAVAGSIGGMSSIVREVNVIESPYLFESYEVADKALDDPGVTEQFERIGSSRAVLRLIEAIGSIPMERKRSL